ncbi:MAG: type II toxin-antitoxin system PemK/MazF family toxin [Chloroflexi bacterium]|nr:type II toxin-antitoxin system PemK/MazF family toxin [Chloroflexota bacterium]
MSYQWNVYLAVLDPVRGSEQAGRRPVLVVSREHINQVLPVVNVVPLTSLKSPGRQIYPNEVLLPAGTVGVDKDSIALCYQIRTLDKSRLIAQLGQVADIRLRMQIIEALRFQLDI